MNRSERSAATDGSTGLVGELIRFGLAGLVGLVVGLGIYEVVYRLASALDHRATFAWAISYFLGIAFQHYIHRSMVFTAATTSYWASLWRTYVIYGVGATLAGSLNLALIESTSWNHRIVWAATTGFVSIVNYVALKVFAYRTKK